jgi:biofilm PGA synthesis N-glycosyltransferase PgaC
VTATHESLESSAKPAAPIAYVLVTPARNEAAFIELTLRSMVAQTVLPLKWVIVSDGSTDGTDEIVARYSASHPWIELLRMPERRERHFAGKVHAFNAGYERVKGLPYRVIGSMDADISFDPEYFAFLLDKLAANAELGLVGTPFKDDSMYDYRFVSIEHVSGACQLFRRECFEAIGGYVPMKSGGIDHVAVISARMKGWKTRTFTEKICHHHRKIGTAQHGRIKSRFRDGALDYALGGHPLWEVFRTAYQMTQRPYVIGGLSVLTGYASAALRRTPRPVSDELVAFRRREQMRRLRAFLGMERGLQTPPERA